MLGNLRFYFLARTVDYFVQMVKAKDFRELVKNFLDVRFEAHSFLAMNANTNISTKIKTNM